MQTSATAAERCLRLDHLLNARQVFGQKPTVGHTRAGSGWLGRQLASLFFGLDCCNAGLNVFQRQFELIGIKPFGFAPEHRLPEGRNQLFQTLVTGVDSDHNRLQCSNIIRKIGHVHHGQSIANPRGIYPCNQRDDSSCRSYSTDKGARASTARTRRQSSIVPEARLRHDEQCLKLRMA